MKNSIILAAGYGTRLGGCIKPLLDIGGKPLISRIISKLEKVPTIEDVYVVTNGLYNREFVEWAEKTNTRLKIILVNDGTTSNESRLGALKDIVFVLDKVYKNKVQDTLIVAGDNLFEDGLSLILSKYRGKPLVGIFDVKDLEKAKNFGVVEVDENNKITGFEEKPVKPRTTLSATAIYLYPAKVLELLREYIKSGNPADRPGDFLVWMVKNNQEIYAHKLEKWWDIGSVESLEAARGYYKSGPAL